MASSKATNRGRHRARRSEDFGVRRWLQVGAASAGMGAALFVVSLTGPQVGVAAADDTGQSSSSASSDAGVSSAGGAGSPTPSASSASSTSANEPEAQPNSEASVPAAGTSTSSTSSTTSNTSSTSTTSSVSTTTDKTTVTAQTNGGTFEPSAERTETTSASQPSGSTAPTTSQSASSSSAATTSSGSHSAASAASAASSATAEAVAPEPVSPAAAAIAAAPWALQVSAADDPRQQAIAAQLADWTNSSLAWVDSLPVPDWVRGHLEGAVLATRRTLFNQAPTVAPVQVTGSSDTAIGGHVDAVDPEGDHIVYRLVKGPTSGTLVLNADGSFAYTPGDGFTGVDSFVVAAQDLGLHVNLLDPFRGAGTAAGALLNKGAVTFSFDYGTGADLWTPERRDALKKATSELTAYFLVAKPVTLTYKVTAENNPQSTTLASASSGLISQDPGFWRTVVQNKLITGVDANGAAADGTLDWNWGRDWALGDTATGDETYFSTMVFHELLHSFGFTSMTEAPGQNDTRAWSIFDTFLSTSNGTKVIDAGYNWDTDYDPNLTGGNGGLFFDGPNAYAAYGDRYAPLFTPNPWSDGSSGSHLDDTTFSGANQKIMNSGPDGPGVKTLSALELAILKDIGYTVVTPTAAAPVTSVTAKTAVAETNSVATTSGPDLATASWALGVTTTVDPRRQILGDQLGAWTNSSLAWVDALPVADDVKWHLDGALWALRRDLLNLTPTVAPVQFTGSASAPISGRVTAVDPEGDQIVYRLVQGPTSGTLQLNDDGSFSYAPGTNFDGVDSFVVMVQDLGLHVNLLDPFRGAGASAGALVNQGAIKFAFDYTTGADTWTPARRAALKDAADAITTYFLVTKPVTLSYSVAGTADPASDVLASAGSGLVGFGGPAFLQTVVQYKLTSGIDANGAAADGILNWNWGYSWALGDSVGSTEFDFRAIVLHELLHSFGFTSYTGAPGTNTGTFWTVYDGFIVDADGHAVITKDYTWDTAFDENLTGGDGGLYFAGPNAVAAYGEPVPLYTPDEYSSSAVAHLDDATFTGADQQLMNAFTGRGPRLRVLSSIELGILKDLGYTVVDALPR